MRLSLVQRDSHPDNPIIATLTAPLTPKGEAGCWCCADFARLAEFGIGHPSDIILVITHDDTHAVMACRLQRARRVAEVNSEFVVTQGREAFPHFAINGYDIMGGTDPGHYLCWPIPQDLPIKPYSIRIPGWRVSQPPEMLVQSGKTLWFAAIHPDRKPWLADVHVQGVQQEIRDIQRPFIAASLECDEDLVG
jgi:hypothetical protein